MKKILATILALVMAIGVTTMAWATETAGVTDVTAGMTDLAEGKYMLTGNVELTAGALTVPAGAKVTLDLNGKTLTNKGGEHTIVNNGTLVIEDSVGGGKVVNVTSEKQVLVNNGTATLNGGHFAKDTVHGYVVTNTGTLTINDGVKMTIWNQSHSSLCITLGANAKTEVKGGEIIGNLIAFKVQEGAELEITGGTITAANQAVQAWSTATISGGVLNGKVIAWSGKFDDVNEVGKITIKSGAVVNGDVAAIQYYDTDTNVAAEEPATVNITGGTVTGSVSTSTRDYPENVTAKSAEITVSGGKFTTADVSQYLESGKQQNADGSVGNIPRYYYNSTTTTDTKKDDNKGTSPKTFDAGVGIYAVSALLSVTGMAYVGKKKF